LAVDAQIFSNHRLCGAHEIVSATEIIDAHRGLVADYLLLDCFADSPIRAHPAITPFWMIGPEGHDQTAHTFCVPGVEILVDVEIEKLVAVSDHQRIIRIDDVTREEHRAGRAFGYGTNWNDVAIGAKPAQFGWDFGKIFKVFRETDKSEMMRPPGTDIFDDPLNHGTAPYGNQWFGDRVAGAGETRAAPGHGNDDLQSFHIEPVARSGACKSRCAQWQ